MTSFKRLNTEKYLKAARIQTEDTLYWKKLSVPTLVKEFGAIDYIDFSPVDPYNFAVSCSVRVQIYNPLTKLVVQNISAFEKNAYGATFRKDGRLLVAGEENGTVRLFETSSKNPLRIFRKHTAAVHRVSFTADNTHIVSFSDDRTVKLWDIPSEKVVQSFEEHQDYIRAGCASPISPNIFISGGYDKVVKVFDIRVGGLNEKSVIFEVNHDQPVDALMWLPTGGIFLSAGGTSIKVWDAFSSGKQIAQISEHHKTITCLRMCSKGRRFMSSGLDRHVKVYDIANYQPVHSFDFPNAVLSLGVCHNDEALVAGMVDGLISIQRMENETDAAPKIPKSRKVIPVNETAVDEVIEDYDRNIGAKYDKFLRKYDYTGALNVVLSNYVMNKNPHITVTLMQELIRRKGLERALAGRTHASLSNIILFIIRYIGDHRFARVLIDVANILLNVYEDKFKEFTGPLGRSFINLAKALHREEKVTKDFLQVQGALELIVSGASVSERGTSNIAPLDINNRTPKKPEFIPSEMAKKQLIIDVN